MSFCDTLQLFDSEESIKGTFTRSGSTLPFEEQAELRSAAVAAAAAAAVAAAAAAAGGGAAGSMDPPGI